MSTATATATRPPADDGFGGGLLHPGLPRGPGRVRGALRLSHRRCPTVQPTACRVGAVHLLVDRRRGWAPDTFLGSISLRHELNDFLREVGGHHRLLGAAQRPPAWHRERPCASCSQWPETSGSPRSSSPVTTPMSGPPPSSRPTAGCSRTPDSGPGGVLKRRYWGADLAGLRLRSEDARGRGAVPRPPHSSAVCTAQKTANARDDDHLEPERPVPPVPSQVTRPRVTTTSATVRRRSRGSGWPARRGPSHDPSGRPRCGHRTPR